MRSGGMAAAFVGGALLGAVFWELVRAISEAKAKAKNFKPQLEQLESTLKNNASVIKQIEKFNEILDHPKSETQLMIDKMKEGKQLVLRCSTVKWNYIRKTRYAHELIKLNSLIDRFFTFDMQAQQTRDNKEILLGMRDLQRSFSTCSSSGNMGGKFNEDGIIRPCSVPDPPKITPGLDVQLQELKRELLRDGKQVIVSATGGTGKTTLIKKLFKDEKVEAAFVGGALLGAVFWELVRAISEAKAKAKNFKPQLEQLESTLKNNASVIEQIEKYNEILDHPKSETQLMIDKMKEGKQLVLRCSTVKWNYIKKTRYADKLIKLNSLIDRFFMVDMQAQQTRDNKEILLGIRDLQRSFTTCSSSGNMGGKFNEDGIIRPCSVPDPPEITPGLDVPLEELKRELLRDGKQVIVVSAPGGTGKTTLIKKLCKDEKVEEKFKDNIFFVTVSKPHNVKVIVQKIFQHMGKDVPEFQTDELSVNDLERLLTEMGSPPILLILDDVWSGSESMLHKFKSQLPNYKILVTSRSVFPKLGFEYNLKPLNIEAAEALFRYTAGGDSCVRDKKLANKILGICKGSPLALTVVGSSLCGRPVAVWKSRVKEWQDATIFHSNTDLLVCLQSSLDALDDTLKECYMDLGSFPQDHRIPVTALIDMWVELYKRDEDDLYAILNDLTNVNLFDLVVTSDDASYKDHFVVQHDLLRDLIIHQSKLESVEKTKRLFIEISGNNFPEWWLEQKLHPVNARLLSISTDETFSSRWHNIKAPAVEVVVLNVRKKEYAMPNFMEKMEKLKVLIVTSCGFLPIELSNFELLGSLSNLKRIRLERVSIPSFDMTTIQMKNLQKISLVLCNLYQVFSNSTFQISDAFPNLKEIDIDHCNDLEALPDGVCDIVSIKNLSITNCHKLSQLPEGIGKLVNLKVLRLAYCTHLEVLPDTIGNLTDLRFLDISECLSITELPLQIGELYRLETLCMRGCSSCDLPTSITNLKNLEVVQCDEETAYKWKEIEAYFTNLTVEVPKEDFNLNSL